jgi:hypothetical protein
MSIIGVLIAGLIIGLFWIVSIGLSAVLVVAASTITGKNTVGR